jgi:hypothetical protein
MSVDEFWALVAEIDWASRQAQPEAEGKRFLRERLSREEAAAFDEHLQTFRFALHDVLGEWEEETGAEFETGDDGFDDLICHIIGLGRQEYEAVVSDPRRALERAQSGDYRESFRYLVPWPEDYE